MGTERKRNKKKKLVLLLEYAAVYILLITARAIPLRVIRLMSGFLGNLFYALFAERRNIALGNLRSAFAGEKKEEEIRRIARESCKSLFLTFLENAKFSPVFKSSDAMQKLRKTTEGLDTLFRKAKRIHDESRGCIFVTPHIGNWEFLPHVSAVAGIPLVVVVRPMDNVYLERLIYRNRADSGQIIIPKRNALFVLQETLRQGRSIGLLPDQSTMQGISVDFFGRKATTTPVPALLSVTYRRPIVVVACCRKDDNGSFEGFVSDPIIPADYRSEKEEIFRITREMNSVMEKIIRKYPGQYLWTHNRWKTYEVKKELSL